MPSSSPLENLKNLRKADFAYSLSYRTRWSDNDQYSHINNSVYYHLFDSIINTYLMEHCGQDPKTSPLIGLVISSWCQFFNPLSFPEVLDLGLRVTKLGKSSVTYQVAIFKTGQDNPSAVGGYTHVFVDRDSRRSTVMGDAARTGLRRILLDGGPEGARSKL